MPYKLTAHTADEGIEAWGEDVEEAFAATILGMFAVIGDPDKVERREIKAVVAEGETPERLIFNLLDECLYVHSVDNWLAGRVLVSLDDGSATAQMEGEPIDHDRHTDLTEVKAPTKHGLKVDVGEDETRVQVLFDL